LINTQEEVAPVRKSVIVKAAKTDSDPPRSEYKNALNESRDDDDKMIYEYIHKKFKRNDNITKRNEERAAALRSTNDQTINLSGKRKSVIIGPSSKVLCIANHSEIDDTNEDEPVIKSWVVLNHGRNYDTIYENDEALSLFANNTLWRSTKNIGALAYMEKLKNFFQNSSANINLGETLMKDYINICQMRTDFTVEYFAMGNRQFRERYLDFICSLDIGDELPTQTLYQLFKRNLSKAEMLTYVHVFNMNEAEEQLDFVLGSQDKKQWRDRNPSVLGLTFSQMMQFMPLLEETKIEMYSELVECQMPILRDKNIIILMIIITVFDLDSVPSVRSIKNFFINILRTYIAEKSANNPEFEMCNVQKCFSTLPKIHAIFKDEK